MQFFRSERCLPLRATILAVLFVVMAGGCSGGDDVMLILRAESSAGEAEVSYRLDGGERISETVDTPWELAVELSGEFDVDLTVTNLSGSGRVACAIEREPSSMSTPSARGEAAADCSVSGSSRGGTLQMSSRSGGTPFGDDSATNDDSGASEESAPIPDGMAAALMLLDSEGVAFEPEEYEPDQLDAVRVAIVVDGVQDADEVQVLVKGEIDDGINVLSLNDRELHDANDVDEDGRLVHTLRVIDVDQAAALRAEFAGTVIVGDVRIPVDDRIDVDIMPAALFNETRALSDGFVTFDVLNTADTLTDLPISPSVDNGESSPVAADELIEIASVAVDGGDVAVFRIARPLTTSIDDVASLLEEIYSVDDATARRTTGAIDGRDSIRFEFEGSLIGTADLITIADEILLVQARWEIDGVETRRVRDSLSFDPEQLPAMSHRRSLSWTYSLGGAEAVPGGPTLNVVYEVPSDWSQLDGELNAFGDSDDESAVYIDFTERADQLFVADLLAAEVELWGGEPSTQTDVELDGVSFGRVDIVGADEQLGVVVLAAVVDVEGAAVGVTVSAFVDGPVEQAAATMGALIDSIRVEAMPGS